MSNLKKEWEQIRLIKIFEVPVYDKRSEENRHLIFDISINENNFIAQHEPTNDEEDKSNLIAFASIEIDNVFSLSVNLQELYEECINKIIDSEYFRLK